MVLENNHSIRKGLKAALLVAIAFGVDYVLQSPYAGLTIGAIVAGAWNYLKHNSDFLKS